MKLNKEIQTDLIKKGVAKAHQLVDQYMPEGKFPDELRKSFLDNCIDVVLKVAIMEKDEAMGYLARKEKELNEEA